MTRKPIITKVKTRAGLDATVMIEPATGKRRDVQDSDVAVLLTKGWKYDQSKETATVPEGEGTE